MRRIKATQCKSACVQAAAQGLSTSAIGARHGIKQSTNEARSAAVDRRAGVFKGWGWMRGMCSPCGRQRSRPEDVAAVATARRMHSLPSPELQLVPCFSMRACRC